LTDALRLELRPFGIETISILPGPVTTRFKENVQTPVRESADAPEVYRHIGEKLRERTPAQKRAAVSAEAVARVILAAASAGSPRTRYYVNANSRASVMLRRLLPDRAWDRIVAKFYGIEKYTK
jgi:short-subunit dehydrogenase